MTAQRFLLCVGAQKAGTTWLAEYLRQVGKADFGITKEYHVWDGLTVPEMAFFDERPHMGRRFRAVPPPLRLPVALRAASKKQVVAAMQSHPASYFRYFARLAARSGLTGDFSPDYTALSEATLRTIAEGIAAQGVEAKAILLVRDPAERCWSSVKMHRTWKNTEAARANGVDPALSQEEAFRAYLDSPHSRLRTDYPAILARLRAVFPADRLFLGCYETLFGAPEIERLSAFAGIAPDPAFGAKQIHTAADKRSLPPDLAHEARTRFADVYSWAETSEPWIAEAWAARAPA